MSKRILAALLCAIMCLSTAALGERFRQVEDIAGVVYYPDGTDEATALYVYRYAYPQVEALDEDAQEAADTINALYAYQASDARYFAVPVRGDSLDPAAPHGQNTSDISYTVTCADDQWFSVLIHQHDRLEGEETDSYSAQVYACATDKPGNVITLPYLLGILAEDESDTFLQDRQTAKADACVQQLVWDALEAMEAAGTLQMKVDFELFTHLFYPEESFYLDENGQPVFFLQPDDVGDNGFITVPLTIEDILDEL